MLPVEALRDWAKICDNTDIPWYLYKETLLCANGCEEFPAELPYAQIAVLAKDFADLKQYVFPALPKDWKYTELDFVSRKKLVSFKKGSQIVLTIDVLSGLETAEQVVQFEEELRGIRRQGSEKRKSKNRAIRVLGRKLGSSEYVF